jgi:hypothetical protein
MSGVSGKIIIGICPAIGMDKTRINAAVIPSITSVFLSGCTTFSSSTAPPAASPATGTGLDTFVLLPNDLPAGLDQRIDGPLQATEIPAPIKKYMVQKACRAVYSDTNPPMNSSRIIKHDIMIVYETDAAKIPGVYQNSLAGIRNKNILPVLLPDPGLGEKSFAIKVSSVDAVGAETNHYICGFEQEASSRSSRWTVPPKYPGLLTAAKRRADKLRSS